MFFYQLLIKLRCFSCLFCFIRLPDYCLVFNFLEAMNIPVAFERLVNSYLTQVNLEIGKIYIFPLYP